MPVEAHIGRALRLYVFLRCYEEDFANGLRNSHLDVLYSIIYEPRISVILAHANLVRPFLSIHCGVQRHKCEVAKEGRGSCLGYTFFLRRVDRAAQRPFSF